MTDYKWLYGEMADTNGDGIVDFSEADEQEYAYDTLMEEKKTIYSEDEDDDDFGEAGKKDDGDGDDFDDDFSWDSDCDGGDDY